jgi:hypothetical protein
MATDLASVLRLEELGVTRVIMTPRSDLRRSVEDVTRLRPSDFTDWCKRVADTVIANVPAAVT